MQTISILFLACSCKLMEEKMKYTTANLHSCGYLRAVRYAKAVRNGRVFTTIYPLISIIYAAQQAASA